MKKLIHFYILHRIYFIIGLIIIGIVFQVKKIDTITAVICYILAALSIAMYFMLGTMRLVQDSITDGDTDSAIKYLEMIKFPALLLKPVRSGYYMLKSNFNMVNNNFEEAEKNIRASIKSKSSLAGDTEGLMYFQLGSIALQKGNIKEARTHLMQAVKLGIPDKENLAAAYLQLCNIEIQRKQNTLAKTYFKKAKAQKPKTEQLVSQIQQMEKYIARIPG